MPNAKRSNFVAKLSIWFFGAVLVVVTLCVMYQNGYDDGYEHANWENRQTVTLEISKAPVEKSPEDRDPPRVQSPKTTYLREL